MRASMSRTKASISSRENTSCSESIGTSWRTSVPAVRFAVPPTFCVGEFSVISSGYSLSSALSRSMS